MEPQKPTNSTESLSYWNSVMKHSLVSALGIQYTRVEDGLIEGTMPVNEYTSQPFGYLHGGAALAFAETLAGLGSNIICDTEHIALGVQVSGNHVSSVTTGKTIVGVAKLLHKGNRTHLWEVNISTIEGRLVSTSRVLNSIVTKR